MQISFIVQGLSEGKTIAADARDEVLLALAERGFNHPRFDAGAQVFSVEIEPGLHSFADVRRTIGLLGKRKARLYLAVVMSP